MACREGRVLITLDKDSGELAVIRRQSHVGIIRLTGIRATDQAGYTRQVLARYRVELEAGALVTAQPGRLRIRPAE